MTTRRTTTVRLPAPEHVDVDSYRASASGSNPVVRGMNVTVSIPETVEIKMVDASVLADYEVWFFIASMLASAVVGFMVAYLQNRKDGSFLAMTLVLALLFAVAVIMTFCKRNKLRRRSKCIALQATEIVSGDAGT